GITLAHQGITGSEGGGVFNIASAVTATTGLRVIEGSALNLSGGLPNGHLITSIEVGGGSTLSLLDGAGSQFSNLTTLNLGNTGTGTVTLNLNVGDLSLAGDGLQTDTLTLLTGGTLNLGNTITFNMTDAGLNENQTYTLLNIVDGGLLSSLTIADFIQGATPGGFDDFTWTVTNNLVQLTTGLLIVGDLYWRGTSDTTWNANVNNWSLNKDGSGLPSSIPGQGTKVIFAYNDIGTGALTTTLEQNFKINSLVFEGGTTTPASVTINAGTNAVSRLEIAPSNPVNGIAITTGGPAAVTIGANLKIGTNQTWDITGASALTISGALFGEANVTKSGDGKVILTGAADPTFNAGQTAVFTVTGGNLEFTNTAAFGTTANSNVASIVVSGGGFYYNNATAGTALTLPHSITLSGGALSGGGATHVYGATINVTAASTINLADSNGAPTAGARSITLAGGLTGTGNLTLNGNNTASAGNQISGTLTLNQNNSAWSGNWNILRGSITTNNANGLGSGSSITMEKGRILFTAGAGTPTITQSIFIASATETAVGEFNLAAGIATTFSGQITLGGVGGAGELRIFMTDNAATATLTGGVVLANDGGLSTQNAATRVLTVDSVISETGGARSLTVNDAAWGGTAGTVLLNKANTYTGGTVLARGVLQLGHVSALSTGALTISGAGTLNSLVDLTGANALSNALNLSAVLTFTGSNGVTFNGLTTNIGAGGLTNSLTSGNLLFSQVNLAESGAVVARTLTIAGAGSGTTTITSLLNNDQNNVLTNNLTGNSLTIGTIALSESALTGRSLTLGGTGNTTVTGVIENFAGGGGTAGSLIKAGTGVLTLEGANTFTGPVAINAGVLDYSTVTNIGGAASNLGQGSAITMAGGTLRFIGSSSQATNRAITTTGSATLAANGTAGATITYNGAITMAANNILTLAGSGEGVITGGITQPAGAATADLSVTSGTWTIQDSNVSIADDLLMTGGTLTLKDMVFTLNDDVVVTGTGAVLNLNTTGVLIANNIAGTSSGLHARTGGIINLGANDIFGVANSGGLDFINVGDSGVGVAGVFNTNTFNITSPGLLVGGLAAGLEGNVTGTGTITVTSTAVDWSLGIRAHRGSISANLAGVASLLKQGLGEMTLSGDNSGLTGTVAATRLDAGSLVLDFTTQNNNKISAVAQLDMRGASLTLNGNNTAASSQSVASFTLANASGANRIVLNNGTGSHGVVLNLGAMTRAVNSQDGTLRIVLPSGAQSATNGVTTTTTTVTGGILGTAAYATVEDGTGTWFATRNTTAGAQNIVALISTPKNNMSTWLAGDHITDETTGFTGTYSSVGINSLRFDAITGSDVNLGITGVLGIATGGILVTDNVTGSAGILGGTLFSGAVVATPELILTHDGLSTFEIGADIRINTILIKTGAGTLLLSGNNTSTGLTDVQNGILQISGGSAIGDTSLVSLSDDKATTFQLLASETIGRLAGGSATAGLETLAVVAIGSHTLTLNQTATSTYSGLFSGNGTIVKTGASTFTYAGTDPAGIFNGSLRIEQGLVLLNGNFNQFAGISGITLTGSTSSLRLDNDQTTAVASRINDTATVTLNSTAGTTANDLGFFMRRTAGTTTGTETVGRLILNSGHNTVAADGTATDRIGRVLFSNATPLVRNNFSTLLVVARNMNATTGQRGRISFSADPGGAIGGGGAAASTTISILPYMVGEDTLAVAPSGAVHFGNSFVRYESGTTDLRPLNLTTEYVVNETAYNALGAGVLTNNIRFTATTGTLAGDTTGINALVLDSATGITVTGPAQSLQITS
ncbi:MAG: autotransporter-associated beta strand repeat-containing protein, partial [Gammaproteobacteria bacterium]|nr:autotransporter-associated beta strand repeat-containing protein [Gammaproteobacteria bacterium]